MASPSIDLGEVRTRARAIEASLCRDSFADFVRCGWHVLEPNGRPFAANAGTDAIILHLQAVAEGKIRMLGIACPPGFGKTTLNSVAFPAWMWLRDPSWRVICASHAQKLASEIGQKFLRVVTSDWYRDLFPHVALESDAVQAIKTSRSGVRYAVGVEGALTGLRGDCGIIDDSLNAIDAESKHEIAKVNLWFDVAFTTRLDQGKQPAIVAVQQRLGELDLIHHVRELGGEILELPARFELGRRCVTSIWQDPRKTEGEILAPSIHSEKFLDEQLKALRPHGFAAQYQQRPAPRGGDIFQSSMWSWCSLGATTSAPRPHGSRVDLPYVVPRRPDGSLDLDLLCVTVDASGGGHGDGASALGCLVYGRKGERRFVLHDPDKGPRSFLQTVADIKEALVKAVAIAGRQPRLVVLVEKKAFGGPAIEQLEKALHDGTVKDRTGKAIVARVRPFEPTGKGDKIQRASAMEPDIAAGLIYLLDGAPWVPAFVEEFGLHPRGSRNDRIDALAQAEIEFSGTTAKDRWRVLST